MNFRFVVLCSCLISANCVAELRNSVSVTNKYIHRGLQYPSHSNAVSWLTEYQSKQGWYVGMWANRQDIEGLRGDNEIDYWVGYVQTINDTLAVDLSISRYTFPSADSVNYDWEESTLAIHMGQAWTLVAGVNRNQFSQGEAGNFFEITHRRNLDGLGIPPLLLDVSVGRVANDLLSDNDFVYGEIGVSKTLGHWQPRFAWSNTSGENPTNYFQQFTEGEWKFSLSYSF